MLFLYHVTRKTFLCLLLLMLQGVAELDQIMTVLMSTSMFIGGVIGFILDNIIPGEYRL